MKVFVNTHSSIKLERDDLTVYFDPYDIKYESKKANVVFFTHSHYDHYSPKDAQKVIGKYTTIIAPCDMKEKIFNDLTFSQEKLYLCRPWDDLIISNYKVMTVPAYNQKKAFHPKENGWLGYVFDFFGKRVFVAGDTDATQDNEIIKCDLLLVPIGGTYTMDYKEAANLTNKIKPKIAIPTHYGSIVGGMELGEKYKSLVDKDIEVRLLIK